MEPDGPQQLIFLFCLLALSAFFSASETALTSLSKIRIRSMMDENIKGAHAIGKMTGNMKKLLSTILVGNNLVNIGLSSLATAMTIKLAGNNSLALGMSTGLVTLAILIFGEITPKTYAAQNSEKISLLFARPVGFFAWLLSPVVAGINKVANFLLCMLGANPDKSAPIITEAELRIMVNVGQEQGVLELTERQMINNVFAFGDYKARDIMTPRTDIVAIPYEASFAEIIKVFEEERFSRMPVYRESTDHIVGIVYFKDFVFSREEKAFCIEDYLRRPFFTYESKPTAELFTELRTKRIPMAIVLDEYGGTAGLLTLEDLIEEIVGEISDEYDDLEQAIKVIKEDEYIVDGGVKIAEVNDMLGTSIKSEDFDSIGGYVVGILGYIPKLGEIVETEHIKFTVEEIDKNRIEKLRICT